MPPKPPNNPYEPPNYNDPFSPGPRDPFANAPRSARTQAAAARKGNSEAVMGFALSLCSLTCCGPLALVSLVMCVMGARREPRGMAIAGIVVSILAILVWLGGIALGYASLAIVGHGSASAGWKLSWDAAVIDAEVDRLGSVPASLDELKVPANQKADPWGNPYEYTVFTDGLDYRLVSVGPDGEADTSDDIQLHPRFGSP